ncbi:hypothetical protein MYX77_00380 [Acidobacteriia bacterium AH_259_A11_L15]|nr:hypothetical protein [Acidobacteriia bacterium AH_259_A11_L15]
MPEAYERRRQPERGKYLILRFYAKLLSFLGFGAAVVGVVFGVLIVLYAEADDKLRYSRALLSVLLGGLTFVILRATAQVIYLLFDVARLARANQEALEKAGLAEAAARSKTSGRD